ncbi:MAG TPA: diadenylate cyclase, partial [Candidatus Limnocylindrales bacterium]
AALGITEQTDAVVVVVSEETGQASIVERARIRRNLDEPQLVRAIIALMLPERAAGAALRGRFPSRAGGSPRPLGPGALRRAALGARGRAVRRGDEPAPVVAEVRDEADGAAAGAGR